MPLEDWIRLNRVAIFENPELRKYVSPFPPAELMTVVSGLTNEKDFAAHGTDIYRAVSLASRKPLHEYDGILDFGCGCGRFARMLKGYQKKLSGCDIDARLINWLNKELGFMEAKVSRVTPPIPFIANEFESVVSISIFTHLKETDQDAFLADLYRVCRPEGRLFITVHGERALQRALCEPAIRTMLSMDEERFENARLAFKQQKHSFVLQYGHLTTISPEGQLDVSGKAVSEPFEYGITFVPENYLREHWGQWFHVEEYVSGSIHDFQDMAVLIPKK